MGSDSVNDRKWKQQAVFLFFVEKKSVVEISDSLKISRKTIGNYLNSLPGYQTERQRRKADNAVKRKEYQRIWDREQRSERYTRVDGDSLRREHELAVLLLSRDKYFRE